MANAVYPKGKQALLGATDLSSNTIKAVLVDTGTYTYSSSHQYLTDLGSSTTGTALTLSSKTLTDGVFDAADGALGTPSVTAEAIVIYHDTGTSSTSPLLVYIDTGVGGLPAASGGAVSVTWNGSGIFSI